jgi:DNA gyrase subunit A
VVQEADDLTLISANGVMLRLGVKDISQTGRATRGVLIMGVQGGDSVASIARLADAVISRS